MSRVIKYELFKITRSPIMLAVLPVAVLVYIIILRFSGVHLSGVYTFFYCISNPIPMMWISVVLASYLFGNDFQGRTVNAPVFSGCSRLSCVLAKTLCYFLVIILIQLVALLITLLIYTFDFSVFYKQGALVSRLGLWLLLSLGSACLPLLFTFIFNDIFVSMGVSAVFIYMMQQLFGYASDNAKLDTAMKLYPAYLQLNISQMGERYPVYLFITAPLVIIFLSLLISFIIFNKRRLK